GLLTAVQAVLAADEGARLRWTNRTVKIAGFPTHMRSECALHRWHVAGDDDVRRQLLAQSDLLAHAVTFIGKPLLLRGLAGAPAPILGRDRAPRLEITKQRGPAVLECDAAARLLLLWGRKAQPFHRLRADADDATVARLQQLLSGY